MNALANRRELLLGALTTGAAASVAGQRSPRQRSRTRSSRSLRPIGPRGRIASSLKKTFLGRPSRPQQRLRMQGWTRS